MSSPNEHELELAQGSGIPHANMMSSQDLGATALEQAAYILGASEAAGRYETNAGLSAITRDERVVRTLRHNAEHIILRDTLSTRSEKWVRRTYALGITSTEFQPPFRRELPPRYAAWETEWARAGPLHDNVVDTPILTDLATERDRASGGFSESWHKRFKSRTEVVKLTAAQMWEPTSGRWLSWLREAFCHLAGREMAGFYLRPEVLQVGRDIAARGGVAAHRRWEDMELEQVLRGPIPALCRTNANNVEQLIVDGQLNVWFPAWPQGIDRQVVRPVRRPSVWGHAGLRLDDGTSPQQLAVLAQDVIAASVTWGGNIRLFCEEQIADFGSLAREAFIDAEIFVSRATTSSDIRADIFAVIADAMRRKWTDPAHRAGDENVWIVAPGVTRKVLTQVSAAWKALPAEWEMNAGRWAYFLAHGLGFWPGISSDMPQFEMTSRDLHALVNHLTVQRAPGCLPNGADAVGNRAGISTLLTSPWEVRLAAVAGLIREASPAFNVRCTYLPGPGGLSRMLKFSALRLARGYDATGGAVFGLPLNLALAGEMSRSMAVMAKLAFADAYSVVDGRFIGWVFRASYLYEEAPVQPPDPDQHFQVGTRKHWGLCGHLEGAEPEWVSWGVDKTQFAALSKWNTLPITEAVPASDVGLRLVHAHESNGTVRLEWRTFSGARRTHIISVYGAAARMAARVWSFTSIPLYWLRCMEGELVGSLSVPDGWQSNVGLEVTSVAPVAPKAAAVSDFF